MPGGGADMARGPKLATAALLSGLMSGCVGLSADGGLSPVAGLTRAELGKDVVKVADDASAGEAQRRTEDLLRRPLTPDSAVQVALLKNRGLQAAFNELGVSEAAYVQATL